MLLYWVSRMWLAAKRGEIKDDPIIFAVKDRVSVAIGLLCAVVVVAATVVDPAWLGFSP
jgi:hypothetical protein